MGLIVLYDVARLISRAGYATPTGIDRVDLRYLEHFLGRPDTTVVGVTQSRNRMVAVPGRDLDHLWRMLKARWLDGGATEGSAAAARLKRRVALRGFAARLWRWRSASPSERMLDPNILSLRQVAPRADLVYVNCSHNGLRAEPLFETIRGALSGRVVIYLHDTIPIDFPEYVRAGFDARHAQRMEVVGRSADLVLTNSAYSRDRFAAFCATRGTEARRTEVLHIGVEPAILARAGTHAPAHPPYFVAVGTIEPRKNLSLLLRVWRRLRESGAGVPELRLIGRRGWTTEANRDFDGLLAAVASDVVELGAVPDTALIDQLAGARALLFPSFVEGWGMPLVEALTLGTPVVGSDIEAFREASQGHARLLQPDDEAGWETAIRGLLHPPASPATPEGFRPPTWQAHFERFEKVLGETLG